MSVLHIETELKNILKFYKIDILQPVTDDIFDKFEKKYGFLPFDLKELYKLTNGFEYEYFRIIPFFDERDKKNTWDSIEKANDKSLTKFNMFEDDFLDNFLIFSEIGGMNIAAFDKKDHSIWFEDDEGYHKTNLTLIEFIRGMCEEI